MPLQRSHTCPLPLPPFLLDNPPHILCQRAYTPISIALPVASVEPRKELGGLVRLGVVKDLNEIYAAGTDEGGIEAGEMVRSHEHYTFFA